MPFWCMRRLGNKAQAMWSISGINKQGKMRDAPYPPFTKWFCIFWFLFTRCVCIYIYIRRKRTQASTAPEARLVEASEPISRVFLVQQKYLQHWTNLLRSPGAVEACARLRSIYMYIYYIYIYILHISGTALQRESVYGPPEASWFWSFSGPGPGPGSFWHWDFECF